MSEAAKRLRQELAPGPYMAISGWTHALPTEKRKEIVQVAVDLLNAEITLKEDKRVMDRDARRIAELEDLLALSQAEVERLDEWITAYAYDKTGFKI